LNHEAHKGHEGSELTFSFFVSFVSFVVKFAASPLRIAPRIKGLGPAFAGMSGVWDQRQP